MVQFRVLLLDGFLLCSVILFQTCSATSPVPTGKCGPDEEYLECGSACPPSCANYGKSIICTAQCVSGCFCKKNLVRNKDGRCIIPERCQKATCNDDEELKACGTSCPDTCDNYGKPRYCTYDCVHGCFCKRGRVRNENFRCVIPERCDKKFCNFDEVYKKCGTACPSTCDDIHRPQPRFCPAICLSGCFCRDGLVRDVDTMKCVRPKDCNLPRCGRNEYYDNCRIPCESTCEPSGCTPECKTGCFCKDGFARSRRTGQCIPTALCGRERPQCGLNECYDPCRIPCEPTCKDPNPFCIPECKPGCYCRPGFIRFDRNGPCVPREFCIRKCGLNEEPSTCVNPCNDCEIKGNCQFLVCNTGCDCKRGFYRNRRNICIPERLCPKTN